MEQFLIEHPAVGYLTIVGLFTVIIWLVKLSVSNSLAEISAHKKRMDSMEFNYKDEFKKVRTDAQEEFKKVRQDANDKHLELIGVLTEVRIEIAELKGNGIHKNRS